MLVFCFFFGFDTVFKHFLGKHRLSLVLNGWNFIEFELNGRWVNNHWTQYVVVYTKIEFKWWKEILTITWINGLTLVDDGSIMIDGFEKKSE